MSETLDGRAAVWCDGAFDTPNGKTAHGLVRFTRRYEVVCVIDRKFAGQDAREVLDGKATGIPIVADWPAALALKPQTLVIGLAPDGGRLTESGRAVVRAALEAGINVDCGLHDFLSEDEEFAPLAARTGARIRDIRKPPHRKDLHHFSGRIDEVGSLRIAVLGTDSAVGKRTTAWLLVHGAEARGRTAEMVGTGQTGWMQGARYSLVLDSLVNDFVSGELEHATLSAWDERRPDLIVIEGQGSLMNPAYPGGFEILAATRPDFVVLQHAPARTEYDGFPGFPIQPIETQIQALELISGRPVAALAINHEHLTPDQARAEAAALAKRTGLPTCLPLLDGVEPIMTLVDDRLNARTGN